MHAHPEAVASIELAGFVLLGLAGSFGHCAGMCAPFVLFVSRRFGLPDPARVPLGAQAWYNAGRIVTYTALGAVAGALGGAVELAGRLVGLQRAAAVIAGAVLVATALGALTRALPEAAGGRVFARIAGALEGRVPGHPFAAGLFLGLLPCGLLYSAVVAAVAKGGPAGGALALACFGLGTTPALLGLALADARLGHRRAFINGLSQVFILTMGVWFLWSGLVR